MHFVHYILVFLEIHEFLVLGQILITQKPTCMFRNVSVKYWLDVSFEEQLNVLFEYSHRTVSPVVAKRSLKSTRWRWQS